MNYSRKFKISKMFSICFPVFITALVSMCFFVCAIYRAFFNAEMTDECYAVAEPYFVANGAVPFVDNWSQMPGFTLLLAPFSWLFVKLNGSTEGIHLYTRILDEVIKVVLCIYVFYLVSKRIKIQCNKSIVFLCFSQIFVAGGLMCFRGDDLAELLMIAAAVTLTVADVDKWLLNYFFSGVLFALSVLCHGPALFPYIYVLILIIVTCRTNKKNRIFVFLGGSVFATLLVIIYLSIAGSFSGIFSGIQYILKDVVYFRLENDVIGKLIVYCKQWVKLLISFVITSIFFYAIIFLFSRSQFENRLVKLSKIRSNRLLFSVTIALFCQIVYRGIYRNGSDFEPLLFISTPFYFMYIKDHVFFKRLFFFNWVTMGIWSFSTGLGGYGAMWNRNGLLLITSRFCIMYILVSLYRNVGLDENDVPDKKVTNSGISRHIWLFAVVFVLVCSIPRIYGSFTRMYREETYVKLDTQITSGPYKYIWTTATRAKALMELEKVVKDNTNDDDYVLCMDSSPYAYLMINGKLCAPSSVDMTLHSYGFNDPSLYYDYFDFTGKVPTKIVYITNGVYGPLSVDDDDCLFTKYVKCNYDLIYYNPDSSYDTKIYALKDR